MNFRKVSLVGMGVAVYHTNMPVYGPEGVKWSPTGTRRWAVSS